MSLLKNFINLLKSDFHIKESRDAWTLEEDSPSTKNKSVRIRKSKDRSAICIPSDKNRTLDILLKDAFPMADYCILYSTEGEDEAGNTKEILWIFCCDLKSDNPSGALTQIKYAKSLMECLVNCAKLKHGKYQNCEVRYRGVIFTSKQPSGSRKRTSQAYTVSYHDADSDLPYIHLDCKETCVLERLCA